MKVNIINVIPQLLCIYDIFSIVQYKYTNFAIKNEIELGKGKKKPYKTKLPVKS